MRKLFTLFFAVSVFLCLAKGQSNDTIPTLVPTTDTALFSFGVFADCQYCPCTTSGSRVYRTSPFKLRNAVHRFNSVNLSFVVSLGDLINSDRVSYDTLIPILRRLNSPFYVVYGNHDFLGEEKADNDIRQEWGLEKLYYSFRRPGWRFIVLNSNDISLSTAPPGTPKHQEAVEYVERLRTQYALNTNAYNGALGSEQLAWLRNELDESVRNNEKVVILNHMPIVPTGAGINLWNDQELETILRRYPSVVAYFCGHHHLGNYVVSDNIHHLNFQGMVETVDNAYAIVHVFADRMEVEGFGREESRTLPLLERGTLLPE